MRRITGTKVTQKNSEIVGCGKDYSPRVSLLHFLHLFSNVKNQFLRTTTKRFMNLN